MPKLKSKGAMKKRFKVTKSGTLVCSRSGRGHFHAHLDGKARRSLRSQIRLNPTWSKLLRPLISV